MIRTQHNLTDKTWFITFTCYQWIPLFEITDSYYLVYNWLNLIAEKYQIQCFGFVIMPNHIHLLSSPRRVSRRGPCAALICEL